MAYKPHIVEISFCFLRKPAIFTVGPFDGERKADNWIYNNLQPMARRRGIKCVTRVQRAVSQANFSPANNVDQLLNLMLETVVRCYKPSQLASQPWDDLDQSEWAD
jgi:hypothetical protein